jgi:hypothetical protein
MKLAQKTIFIGIFGVGILLLSACRHPFHHGSSNEKFDWFAEKLVDYLDMDEEQQRALMEMREDYVKEATELHKERMKLLKTISTQLRSSSFETSALKKALEDQNVVEKRMEQMFIRKAGEMHTILREDQRNKLAEKLEHILEEHQEYGAD